MKKLRFSSVIVLLSILSMGMGFPDIVSDRADESDTTDSAKRAQQLVKTQAIACSRKVYKSAKVEQESAKVEIRQKPNFNNCESLSLCEKATSSINNIALKLFDNKGNILLIENIAISDVFSSDYPAGNLPEGSTFVMFHGNTAYYFLDPQKIAYVN